MATVSHGFEQSILPAKDIPVKAWLRITDLEILIPASIRHRKRHAAIPGRKKATINEAQLLLL
jgi:hypothetical protein